VNLPHLFWANNATRGSIAYQALTKKPLKISDLKESGDEGIYSNTKRL
jgi:hypothetical protein